MKYFDLQLANSKLMLVQFAPQTADPKLHGHGDEYQLSIPLVGSPFVQYNADVRQLLGKQWCITSPGERHMHFSNDQASRLLLINFHETFLQKVLEDRLGQTFAQALEFAPWAEGPTEAFRKAADHVIKQALDSSPEQVELLELEYELASLLFTLHKGNHTEKWRKSDAVPKHPAIHSAIQYIHEEYGNQLSLDQVAQAAGLSKFHLVRLFREHVGCTPAQYITDIRMNEAERLLRTSAEEVTQIAFDVGFGSLNTFERLFKKKHGVSASQYRKSL